MNMIIDLTDVDIYSGIIKYIKIYGYLHDI